LRRQLRFRRVSNTLVASWGQPSSLTTPSQHPLRTEKQEAPHRHFLSADITPHRLLEEAASMTSSQRRDASREWMGGWIRAKGKIVDVSEQAGCVEVSLTAPGFAWSPDLARVIAHFDADWRDRATRLSKGGTVLISGRVASVDPGTSLIDLEHAEIAADPTEDRHFLDEKVSPYYLVELMRDKTTAQAQAIATNYLGGWMRLRGVIKDVSASGQMNVELDEPSGWKRFGVGLGVALYANFDKQWHERVSRLPSGATVALEGQLVRAVPDLGGSVTLDHCELLFKSDAP